MATSTQDRPAGQPPQEQDHQPGSEREMTPRPDATPLFSAGQPRLLDRRAFISGGDSGIGRAIALAFAAEGADVAIGFLEEEREDAEATRRGVEEFGRTCLLLPADLRDSSACTATIERVVAELGGLDVLVSNAGEQHPVESFEDVTDEQVVRTFETNVFAMLYLVRAALPHLGPGSSIITTSSVTAYQGNETLLDYTATKGAVVSFTCGLSQSVAERGIRVNSVAPGPIWTPLIPATFPADKVASFGTDVPLGRAGQPNEVASCYVFLASDEGAYITGQVLHPNGGKLVGG
jgi:NAD(P)-dependent dehydrogenase (short-subunit alcohol dehydrogenase family)